MTQVATKQETTANRMLMCTICGWVYHEARGLPGAAVAPGTPWAKVPRRFACPECTASTEWFQELRIGS